MVQSCGITEKVWRVSDLNVPELGLASLLHDELQSNKILCQLLSIIYALAVWIKVHHLSSGNLFKDRKRTGDEIMFNQLARIQHNALPPISFLSKLEWNHLSNCPASDLKCSSAEVIDIEDKDDIIYSQQYLVATSTKTRAYQFPPNATHSPNTVSTWKLSRYLWHFFIGFPLGVIIYIYKGYNGGQKKT